MSQIWRHTRLDLTRARWMIALFIGALALYASRPQLRGPQRLSLPQAAEDWDVLSAGGAVPLAYALLAIVFVILISTVIRNDSPTNSDAYWRTTPLSALRLLQSKIVTLSLALIVPAIVANTLVLARLTVTAGEIAQITTHSLGTTLPWLITIAIIAAVTPTLTSFILTLLAYLAAVLVRFTSETYLPEDVQQQILNDVVRVGAVCTGAQCVWLVSIYLTQRRSVVQTRIVSACIVLAPLVLTSAYVLTLRGPLKSSAPATVPTNFTAAIDSGTVVVRFEVPAPDRHHQLSIDDLHLSLRDSTGATVPLMLTMFRSSGTSSINGVITRHEGAILEPGTDALTIDSSRTPAIAHVTLRSKPIDTLRNATIARAATSLDLSGVLVSLRLDTTSDVPVSDGLKRFSDGTYVRSRLIPNSDGGSALQLEYWMIGTGASQEKRVTSELSVAPTPGNNANVRPVRIDIGGSAAMFTLVSRTLGDSLRMSNAATYASGTPLPIPGGYVKYRMQKLERMEHRGIALTVSDTHDARLVGTTWLPESRILLKTRTTVR